MKTLEVANRLEFITYLATGILWLFLLAIVGSIIVNPPER